MKYAKIREGIFISRPNRFIAIVNIDGKEETCHVKNTGRCKELLIKGSKVFLEDCSHNPNRKTKYDLITVYKGDCLVNMDSQAPNKVVQEWLPTLFPDITLIRPETKYKNSRFDFYVETEKEKIFMEVKGVTLEVGGEARFPAAPTERGVKHIQELVACRIDGYEAYIIFVVQMKGVTHFVPNVATHPEFAEALREAKKQGVNILCYDCKVESDELVLDQKIEVSI